MVETKRDPKLAIDDLTDLEETLVAEPRTSQAVSGRRKRNRQQEPKNREVPVGRKGTGGIPGWIWLVLLVLVAGIGGLQWQLFRLQVSLQEAESQSETLESQLSETGASLLENKNQMADTLKLHDSEIRKLWDVSNKRNKANIASNTAEVKRLTDELAKLQKSFASLQTKTTTADKSLKSMATEVAQLSAQVSLLQDALQISEQRLGKLETQLGQFNVNHLKSLQQSVTALQQKMDTEQAKLSGRLAETEEAVKAHDAFRKQMAQRQAAIKSQIDELYRLLEQLR